MCILHLPGVLLPFWSSSLYSEVNKNSTEVTMRGTPSSLIPSFATMRCITRVPKVSSYWKFILSQSGLKKWISHQERLMTMEEFTYICSYLPIYSPPDAFLSSPLAVFTPTLCWFDSISLHGTFSSRIAITKSSFFYFQCSHIVIFIWFVHSTSSVCLHIFL